MRITSFMIYDQLSRAIGNTLEDYSELSASLTTGKKINKPSDDVIGLMKAMDYRVSINDNGQYARNVDEASSQLGFTDTVMKSVSDSLLRTKEIVIGGASGTLDDQNRTALAQESLQLRNLFLDMGNSRFRDRCVFSGFRTDIPAYNSLTFVYQGDNGVINAPIDKGAAMPVNVIGSEAFSYTLSAPDAIQITGGRYVHYTPGAGTTIDVEIRDTDDTTVLDAFSFSNVIQMTDILSSALSANNPLRIAALLKPFDKVQEQVSAVQANIGSRLAYLKDQTARLNGGTLTLKNTLSKTEDAEITEIAAELTKTDTALKALLSSSTRVLSQSLLDFLR